MKVAYCLLALGTIGCSAYTSGGATRDAAVDQASPIDQASPVDSSAADRQLDAGPTDGFDAGFVCQPLTDWSGCSDRYGDECQATWAGVLRYPLCSDSGDGGALTRELRMDCGDYHVREINHATEHDTYIYAVATGQLVEIQFGRPISLDSTVTCFGPSGGIALDCSNVTPTQICASDGTIIGDPSGCVAPLDAAIQCPGTTVAFCQPTWAGVLASTCQIGIAVADQRWNCGPYHVRTITFDYNSDVIIHNHYTKTAYYDVTTGEVIAIFGGAVVPDTACANGPPAPIEADCLPSATVDAALAGTDVCVADGGIGG